MPKLKIQCTAIAKDTAFPTGQSSRLQDISRKSWSQSCILDLDKGIIRIEGSIKIENLSDLILSLKKAYLVI